MGRAIIRNFLKDVRGNSALLFGLSMPALVGVAGVGTETGYWYYRHLRLQEIADLAAYGGAVKLRDAGSATLAESTARTDAALHGFDSTTGTMTVNTPPTSGTNMNTRSVEILLSTPEPRILSAIFTTTPVTISVRAVASYQEPSKACVLALSKTASNAVSVGGNAAVNFAGCSVQSNSISESSFYIGGSAHLTAPCVSSVGGMNLGAALTLTECSDPKEYAPYVEDPYKDLEAPPIPNNCTNEPHDPNGAYTLDPAKYCNGLMLQGDVTLNPGVYVIKGGTLHINAGANVTGDGVMFYLTDGADVNINGNANLNLNAATTGTYKGMLFFGDRTQEVADIKFNGSATSKMVGILYFPSQNVEVQGNFGANNGCGQIVAQTVVFSGSPNFKADCTGSGIDTIAVGGMVKVVE